ncbi:hypothetical protein [Gracilimonas tropica]|uniref:hypothetical protein n=1 Tax=Gracilimonas tropica TaxID=454600 RepID=UPI000373F447|nr:hypothetical protein [Gracilimonas tropica]
MFKRYFSLGVFMAGALLSCTTLQAQDTENLNYRKWRVTLFPPLSSNGTNAVDYTARYSINLLVGYHGGLDGAEFGGLVNYNKYYANGFQLAGLVNGTGGDMAGVNIAGLSNFSSGDMSGIQVSGLANISGDNLEGINASGLLNYAEGNSSGLQFAGIGNLAKGDIEGLQGGGILNASWGDISGLQVAGVANIARNSVEGLQVSGGINLAGDDLSGLQVSSGANLAWGNIEGLMITGGVNVARGDASGLLISGGLNIANELNGASISGGANIAKELTGLQFAGLLNASEKATGLQIGLINVAKEFNGVPIGLISYYGNGRKNIDVRFSDGGFTDLGITLGTHRVYNSAILGYNTLLDRNVYRIGLAVGLEKNIQDSFRNWQNETMYVNQEFAVTHQFEEKWSDRLNLIYSYKFLLGKRFGNGFSVYGGPSFNAQVTRVAGAKDYTWYSLWSPEWKGRDYRFWVGFTAGIRLFKQKAPQRFEDEFNNWDIEW